MPSTAVTVGLPIADRATSYRFYTEVLGLTAFGEPGEDGVPEPLQFALNEGVHLILIPTGGFGWVIGDRDVTPPGHNECIVSLSVGSESAVHELNPGAQPWGYAATFADLDGHIWMVTSG